MKPPRNAYLKTRILLVSNALAIWITGVILLGEQGPAMRVFWVVLLIISSVSLPFRIARRNSAVSLSNSELLHDISQIREVLASEESPTVESIGLAIDLNGAKTLTYSALRAYIIEISVALGFSPTVVLINGHRRTVLRRNA